MEAHSVLKDVAIGRVVDGVDTTTLPEKIRLACVEGARAIELLAQIGSYATNAKKKRDKRDRERERVRQQRPGAAVTALPAKQGARWSPEEDTRLSDLFISGAGIEVIAVAHNRSPVAIVLRLLAKALIEQSAADAHLARFRQGVAA